MLRSIFAVLTGYLTMVVIVALATFLLQAAFPAWFLAGTPPPTPYLALNIAFSFFAAFIGGWTAARIATRRQFAHAISLAAATFLLAVVSTLYASQGQPRWYQILLAVLMPLTVLAGGWIRARAVEAREEATRTLP